MNEQNLNTIPFSFFCKQSSILMPFYEKALFPWDLHELWKGLLTTSNNNFSKEHPLVYFSNAHEVVLGKNVFIEKGALIEGPCYIGDNARIGHSAYIRKGSFLAPNTTVGHCSEINRSILFEGAKAPHFNYVGDSIIGANVNLGCGATITNLRLDQKEVSIYWGGEEIETRKRKFGALIGEGASIGAYVVINPGSIIKEGAKVAPLQSIVGTI